MTALALAWLLLHLGFYGLALLGVVVAAVYVRIRLGDFHTAARARLAAYTGGPVHLTHRLTRSAP